MSAGDEATTGSTGCAATPICPECDHPLDEHGESGCMDFEYSGECDNLGFCVCKRTLTELLPPILAAADAAVKLDVLRRQQARAEVAPEFAWQRLFEQRDIAIERLRAAEERVALLLCERHQVVCPTRQPCAACSQDAAAALGGAL